MAKAKQRYAKPWNIDMIFMDVLCYDVGKMDQVDKGAWTAMQSLQRDRTTKNMCETLIFVSQSM